jgi:hypothetical protein
MISLYENDLLIGDSMANAEAWKRSEIMPKLELPRKY